MQLSVIQLTRCHAAFLDDDWSSGSICRCDSSLRLSSAMVISSHKGQPSDLSHNDISTDGRDAAVCPRLAAFCASLYCPSLLQNRFQVIYRSLEVDSATPTVSGKQILIVYRSWKLAFSSTSSTANGLHPLTLTFYTLYHLSRSTLFSGHGL